MNLRHVLVLLQKEFSRGLRNFMFIFAIVVPLVITAVVTLLFGTVFSGKARLGIVDQGDSQIPAMVAELDSIQFATYESDAQLREVTEDGDVDVGIVIPAGFDATVQADETATFTAYIWGESLIRDRASAATAFTNSVRDLIGVEAPIDIVTITLGDEDAISWEARLLPFIVLMTIVIGGSMVPATSLVDEKQKRTLRALTTTPASLADVLIAKGAMGAILSLVMGVVILILNRAFGQEPVLLVVTLALGAILAAAFGMLLGAFVKDINTLFTVVKGIGILLYAPAIIYLFPSLPQWISQIFPTYYMIQPVIEITQEGAGWAEVAPELGILVGLIVALIGIVTFVVQRAPQSEGALNPT